MLVTLVQYSLKDFLFTISLMITNLTMKKKNKESLKQGVILIMVESMVSWLSHVLLEICITSETLNSQ